MDRGEGLGCVGRGFSLVWWVSGEFWCGCGCPEVEFGFGTGHSIVLNSGFSNARVSAVGVAARTVAVRAAGGVIEASASDASEEPAPAITTMLSEAELLKRKAKKAELRRRRLVRKRKLRKKGKWPPSKMAKLKNV